MRIAISQPCFLPWPGYFGLIDYVDEFIFLDNVQFEKRSWQQRNYIILNENPHLITLPIISKKKFNQTILQAKIVDLKFKKEIKTKIFYAYKKKKYFDLIFPKIEYILNNKDNKLIDINLKLINLILKILKINTDIDFQSNLNIKNKKEKLIFEICSKKKKCEEYISTIGSKNYLNNYTHIPGTTKTIKYFTYNDINFNKYNHALSVIDLIFDYGEDTINIIRENFRIIDQ